MAKVKNIEQFGNLFGKSIHTIEVGKVDAMHKSKPEEVSIKVPAVLHTIKSINVNSLRIAQIAGGADVVMINGGSDGLTIGMAEKLINKSDDYKKEEEKTPWFGQYAVASDICNAANRSEIERLATIKRDVEAQIDALNAVIESNNRAAAQFTEE